MPLYEYRCEACGRNFELIQKFSDPPPEHCPNCGKGPIRKLMSSPAIQFKGTGWYVTDYAKKDSGAGARAAGNTKADTNDKSEKSEKSDSEKKTDAGGDKPASSTSESSKKE